MPAQMDLGGIRDLQLLIVPCRQARLEHFEEIWQFGCLRRQGGVRGPGPKVLKNLDESTQNRTKHRNPAQAIPAARAHSYRLATHNRCERLWFHGRFMPPQ
jgi:hypothetical protein